MSRRLTAVAALVISAAALTACSGGTASEEGDTTQSGAGSDFGLVTEGTLTVATVASTSSPTR